MIVRNSLLLWMIAGAALGSCGARAVAPGPAAPLSLEKVIPLPGVKGRIDHLAFDPLGRRLFVAEIANGTVDAVDLQTGSRSRIGGLREPQGVALLEPTQQLAVASGDGTVKFFAGSDLRQSASLTLGDDADDVRVEPATGDLIVGYGSGALATIDPRTHQIIRRLALPAHPEGFSVDGDRAWINLPDAGVIVAADLRKAATLATWRTGLRRLNFPMALDRDANLLAVGFRLPAALVLVDAGSGEIRQSLGTCGDTDDLYFDRRLGRLYVVCGSGKVDVFRRRGDRYVREARVISRPGARTGLFDPASGRLFVAAPEGGGKPAAILVLRTSGEVK
jgi:hypothetical protein